MTILKRGANPSGLSLESAATAVVTLCPKAAPQIVNFVPLLPLVVDMRELSTLRFERLDGGHRLLRSSAKSHSPVLSHQSDQEGIFE
jgi:hypothetical protein